MRRRLPRSTSSQAARQYPTMRTRIKITGERAAGTGVCDRHRLTAMAGQPTPTFRGRLRLIAFARHDRSLPGPAHATYSLTDLVTRHVRGRRECTPVGWSRRLQDLPEGVN